MASAIKMNDPKALYKIYADWTGNLHHWVETQLGRNIDCEYFPDSYQFKIYSGGATAQRTSFAVIDEDIVPISTVPNLVRPVGERDFTLQLPRPESDPSQAELDAKFRELCLAAARGLEIDLGKHALIDRKE